MPHLYLSCVCRRVFATLVSTSCATELPFASRTCNCRSWVWRFLHGHELKLVSGLCSNPHLCTSGCDASSDCLQAASWYIHRQSWVSSVLHMCVFWCPVRSTYVCVLVLTYYLRCMYWGRDSRLLGFYANARIACQESNLCACWVRGCFAAVLSFTFHARAVLHCQQACC